MSDEAKNVFERKKPQSTLADDRQNPFQRKKELVDAQRRDTSQHDARVQHHEEARATWTKQADAPTAAGGTRLSTAELVALKAASDADREQRRDTKTQATVPFIAPTVATITAIVNGWKTTPNGRAYFDSAFNHRNLTLRVREQFELGALVQWSIEALDETFSFLLANNYLETQFKTASIHPRGMPAPKPYPYVSPEEAAEETERERIDDIGKTTEEVERALNLPFNELQKQVRQGFKSPKPGGPNLDRS
jgi:hypothetical protein